MNASNQENFGFLRSLIWPIHRTELKKVLSMLFLLFLLCICYNILRNLKDTIVLTAKASGAEVIPFIKVWGMLPGVFLATWFYTRLASRFKREHVFYILISAFLSYFLLFAFVIYPHSEALHLDRLGDWLTQVLPKGFNGLIAMVRNWTFTSFYVISELWSVLVLAVLYWGFANDITQVSQAKRTYGILNIGSNVAPILGGTLGIIFSYVSFPFFVNASDPWQQTLDSLILLLTGLGLVPWSSFIGLIALFFLRRSLKKKKLTRKCLKSPNCGFLSERASVIFLNPNISFAWPSSSLGIISRSI